MDGLNKERPHRKLVKIHCPKCGDFLTETLPTAEVACRRCNRWVRYQEDGGAVK